MREIRVVGANGTINIKEISLPQRNPLSFYVSVAAEMANFINDGKKEEAAKHLHDKLGYSNYLGDMSYHEMTAAIAFLFVGKRNLFEHKLRLSIDMLPKNAYSISLYTDLVSKDDALVSWAKNRIEDIISWSGTEDVISIGDSHSHFSFSGVARAKIVWLGPVTMHRVGRDGFRSFGLDSQILPKNGCAVFSFGQIDASYHIAKQANAQGISRHRIMRELVEKYIDTVLDFVKERSDVKIIISGIIPPSISDINKAYTYENAEEEIVDVYITLNSFLQRFANIKGVFYLDMYNFFCDEKGILKEDCSFGDHHLNSHFYENVERRILGCVNFYSDEVNVNEGKFCVKNVEIPKVARIGLQKHSAPLEIIRMGG